MKQQKRTIEEHHHHYSYDWSKFMIKTFIAFLYFILIVNLLSAAINKIGSEENIYDQCTSSCSKKHFMGYQLGIDQDIKKVVLKEGDGVMIYNPTIEEFDRTYCIKSCNDMYLKLRGLK